MSDSKVFIDYGARKGESLHLFLDKRPDLKDAKIVFYEPCETHFGDLQAIKKARASRDIEIVEKAVWVSDGLKKFTEYHNDLANTITPSRRMVGRETRTTLVPTIDVCETLSECENKYTIVKMDIEGAEIRVLMRLIRTGMINRINELMVEYHRDRNQVRIAKIHKALKNPQRYKGILTLWPY